MAAIRQAINVLDTPPNDGPGVPIRTMRMVSSSALLRTRVVMTTLALVTWLPLPLKGQSEAPDLDTSLRFSGDFRLRFEETDGDDPGNPLLDSRQRLTLRFRAGITKYYYRKNRLVTGTDRKDWISRLRLSMSVRF